MTLELDDAEVMILCAGLVAVLADEVENFTLGGDIDHERLEIVKALIAKLKAAL